MWSGLWACGCVKRILVLVFVNSKNNLKKASGRPPFEKKQKNSWCSKLERFVIHTMAFKRTGQAIFRGVVIEKVPVKFIDAACHNLFSVIQRMRDCNLRYFSEGNFTFIKIESKRRRTARTHENV